MEKAISYKSTLEMSHETWLKERKSGIGGSDVAAILGLSKWRTPREVYEEKISQEIIQIEENAKMKAGKKLESVIAEWYEEETGRKLHRDNKIRIHRDFPFLFANVDRLILPQNGEGRGILEIKTTSSFSYDNWEDEIPIPYFCQIQHYFNVTGLSWGEFALLINGWDFRRIEVKRDEEFIQMMNDRLAKFWVDHVIQQIPPYPATEKEIKEAYPKHAEGKIIEATYTSLNTIREIKKIRDEIKQLEEKESALKISLQNEMQDAELICYEGSAIATWKKDSDSLMIDSKKLKIEMPHIFEQYSKVKQGARKFIIKYNLFKLKE